MTKELHLTKKDFRIEWFSGTGPGGQHRNKHQNCCRIIHVESGLKAQATEGRDRPTNQRNAFNRLVSRLVAHYSDTAQTERYAATETIRNYHELRNEVHDKASGFKQSYKKVVVGADLGDMIEARCSTMKALEVREGVEHD